MNILDFIPTGKENAISREALVFKTGVCDREVRKLIEDERINGAMIVSFSDSKGYYIATREEEISHYVAECHAKATKEWSKARLMRDAWFNRYQVTI